MNETSASPHRRSRREFLQALPAAAALASPVRAAAGRERTGIAVIGTGGMGTNHVRTLAKRDDLAIRWLIDADLERAKAAAKALSDLNGAHQPRVGQDLRDALGDEGVRACFIATPDHWHAPAALLALSAGKHVYVEKPCAHNLREGRALVTKARETGLAVQVGTQSRSAGHVREVIARIASGAIGEVLSAKAWNSQKRADQGHQPDSEPPSSLDYEMWLGPVPRVPFKKTYHPAHWRWFFHFGAGDFGNDGVHDIDIARWGLGGSGHPSRIVSLGDKLFFEDDQEWPDTLSCGFAYEGSDGRRRHLHYEQRIWSPYVQEGHENGCAWYGTEGMIVGGKAKGWEVYGPKNCPIGSIPAAGDMLADHHENFLAVVRGDAAPESLHAPVEDHHFSSSLCQLGNLSWKLGRDLDFDPVEESVISTDPDFSARASRELTREYCEHWARPRLD